MKQCKLTELEEWKLFESRTAEYLKMRLAARMQGADRNDEELWGRFFEGQTKSEYITLVWQGEAYLHHYTDASLEGDMNIEKWPENNAAMAEERLCPVMTAEPGEKVEVAMELLIKDPFFIFDPCFRDQYAFAIASEDHKFIGNLADAFTKLKSNYYLDRKTKAKYRGDTIRLVRFLHHLDRLGILSLRGEVPDDNWKHARIILLEILNEYPPLVRLKTQGIFKDGWPSLKRQAETGRWFILDDECAKLKNWIDQGSDKN